MARRQTRLEISATGGPQVEQQLRRLGESASQAFERSRTSADRASQGLLGFSRTTPTATRGLRALDTASASLQDSLGGLAQSAGPAVGAIARLGPAGLAAAAAIATITLGASKGTRAAIDFEKALVGVGKTTDLEGQALERLGERVNDSAIALASSAGEMLETARAAGQLGVQGADNIIRFTETVTKLGSASDLAGDQAATTLARLLTVTGETTDQVDVLGSVIVSLGNQFAATESEIANTAQSVAASTARFEVSSTQAAALGAAIAAVGQEAEAGGTAVGKAFEAIDAAIEDGGQGFERLQEIVRLSGEELRAQFARDPSAIFGRFIEGLQRIQEEGGNTTAALEEFGLTDIRVRRVLGALAGASDTLSRALADQRREVRENTALNTEFERSLDTTGASMDRARAATNALGNEIGSRLSPLLRTAADRFADLAERVLDFIQVTSVERLAEIRSELEGLQEAAQRFGEEDLRRGVIEERIEALRREEAALRLVVATEEDTLPQRERAAAAIQAQFVRQAEVAEDSYERISDAAQQAADDATKVAEQLGEATVESARLSARAAALFRQQRQLGEETIESARAAAARLREGQEAAEAAARARDAARESVAQGAPQIEEELGGAAERAAERFERTFTDAIANIVRDGKIEFDELGDALQDIFARAVAESITSQVRGGIEQFISGDLGNVQLGGLFSTGREPPPGAVGSGLGPPSIAQQRQGGFTLGGAAQGAGIGFATGSTLHAVAPDTFGQTGSTVGGVIGGAIGSIWGPVGTAVGSVLGSVVGGFIGGLVGSGSSNAAQITGFSASGRRLSGGATGGKFEKEVRQAADGIGDSLEAFFTGVARTTGAEFRERIQVQIGQRDPSRIRLGSGSIFSDDERTLRAPTGDPQAALSVALGEVVDSLEGLTQFQERVLSRSVDIRGGDIQDILGDIAFLDVLEDLRRPLTDADRAVAQINDRFDELALKARDLGIGLQIVERARDREIGQLRDELLQTLNDFQRPVTGAAAEVRRLNEQFDALAEEARAIGGLHPHRVLRARQAQIEQLQEDFQTGIRRQLLAITDPLEAELEKFEERRVQRIRNARSLGVLEGETETQIQRLHIAERQRIIEQFSGGGGEAPQSFRDTLDDLRRPLTDAEREVAQINDRFDDLASQARVFGFGLQIVERAREREIDLLRDDLLDALNDLDEPATGAAAEIRRLNDQFDQLREQSRALGVGISRVERIRREQLDQLQDDFETGISRQILAITDPLQGQLEAFKDVAQRRLDDARVLGANLVEVERLNALEREQILEQTLEGTNNRLERFLTEQTASPAARGPLQETLRAAEQRFANLVSEGRTSEIPDAAGNLLELAEQRFASSARFFEIRDDVLDVVRGLLDRDQTSAQERLLQGLGDEAIEQNRTLRSIDRRIEQNTNELRELRRQFDTADLRQRVTA